MYSCTVRHPTGTAVTADGLCVYTIFGAWGWRTEHRCTWPSNKTLFAVFTGNKICFGVLRWTWIFDVRDCLIAPVNHEDRDSAVFANRSVLLVQIQVRHRISASAKRNDRRNDKKKTCKKRPVGPYVTLLRFKTENKTQSKVASSSLPNDSVFAFSSFRSVSFSRLAGAASHVFYLENR